MPRPSDNTRARLVAAAKQLLYEQGMHNTSLAEIASLASVPVGNVYYHFRTKDMLISAVIQEHVNDLRAKLARLDTIGDPHERLREFVRSKHDTTARTVRYGCPYGSLSAEIEKAEGELPEQASQMLGTIIDWVRDQFAALGYGDEAYQYAVDLIANLQGTMLLGNTFHSEELVHTRLTRIEHWLDTIKG
jgi:AcrR family transcriptional regulator